LRGLFRQVFHAFTNVDGRLLRSFRYLVFRPGALTEAYVRGRRIPFIGPFQLFLLANVLFFATQSLTSTNVVSSTLDSHLNRQDWSDIAGPLVAQRLETTKTTLAAYAPLFDRAIVLNAKSFIIVMTLPFALLLPALFYRSRRPFVVHAIFSLHFYAFLLLLFCVSMTIAAVDVRLGGAGLDSSRMDNALSIVNLAAATVYLFAATGMVYGAGGVGRIVKVLTLGIAAAAILLAYRFALLIVTLHTT